MFVHISRDKNLDEILNTHSSLLASVDAHRRQNIMRNHTATHLMLAGLRKVLGTHIVQKGSYQNEDVTRFDFSHFAKVTDEELKQVEDIVNAKIRANIAQKTYVNVPIDEAIKKGATATFGEKYGDFVRVVEFDPQFSVELCGGTHVLATGEIALFKFTSEGSVSAGVRRVEAVTGEKALELWNEELQITNTLRDIFKGQKDLVKAVEGLIAEKAALQKRIEALENEKLQQTKQSLLAQAETKGEISAIIARVEVANADALKSLAYQLKESLTTCYIVLGTVLSGKPQLAVMLSEDLVAQGKHAGNIVKDLAKEVKGGGGGQPFFATAGGSDASGLDAALAKAKTIL